MFPICLPLGLALNLFGAYAGIYIYIFLRQQVFPTNRQTKKVLFFPTSLWGFCFLACIPPVSRPPSRPPRLCHLISQLLISHNSSHTQLISQLISHIDTHTDITQRVSYTTHLAHLISYITSHTTHLTHNSSHTTLISHTHTHAHTHHKTCLIHNSSHTPHLIHHITHHSSHTHTHTSQKTYLIIHKSSHIIHNSSHTQLILHTTHLTDSAWQAQYAELPEEGVARKVAAVAAARCCVAGAVHRAFCRSWGADCRRLGRAFSVRGRRNTQSLLTEGAAARIVAGWAAALLCVAGAVHRAS